MPADSAYAPIASAIIAAATFVGLAIGKLPRLRMNRAAIALAGASVYIAPHGRLSLSAIMARWVASR